MDSTTRHSPQMQLLLQRNAAFDLLDRFLDKYWIDTPATLRMYWRLERLAQGLNQRLIAGARP